MRRRPSANTNTSTGNRNGSGSHGHGESLAPPTVKSNAEAVALGLRGLDEADVLCQNGRLQAALDLYQSAIEVLIQMLQGEKLRNSGYDKEGLSARVAMALSDAEQLKETLRTRQTSGEASTDADAKSPLKKTCFSRISSYLASVRSGTATVTANTNTTTNSRPSTTHPIHTGSSRSLSAVHQQPAGSQRRLVQTSHRKVTSTTSTSSRPIQSKATSPTSSSSQPSSAVSASQRLANNESNMLKTTVLDDMYIPPTQLPAITWDDIAGLSDCKQALQEAAIMPMLRPDLFTGLRKPQNILLYGPPGTGTSLWIHLSHSSNGQCATYCKHLLE